MAARTSAFQFTGKGHDLRDVGEKLNVKTVLEGSVRKAGKRLRINAQLINASDGYHLWSERYDRDMDDVFAVQDEIASAVVGKLKVKLLGEQQDAPVIKRPTENLEAYNLYLRGRYHFARYTEAAIEKAVECFTQALAVDPTYHQARAGVATAQAVGAALSVAAPHDLMPIAKEAALEGLAIDETMAGPHLALGIVLHRYEWDWPAAEREYRRALDLNPGDSFGRLHHALLLAEQGHADAAIDEARHAVERDPLLVFSRHVLALVLHMARRFDAAIAEARAGIELEPHQSLYWNLGWASAGLGRHDEAVEALRQATTIAPGDSFSQGLLCWALGLAGQRQEANTILDDLERRRTKAYVSGWLMAHARVGLDARDQAISWLQRAAKERDLLLPYLNTWSAFDPLRSDPRFQALLKKMNFPDAPA